MMPITALVAALLAPLYILLTFRVINVRRTAKVAIGDGGDSTLVRRMRVHANFAENVPFTLLLMGLSESLGAPRTILYLIGACLMLGRLSHAYGVSQTKEIFTFRITGMILTMAATLIAAATCASLAVSRI